MYLKKREKKKKKRTCLSKLCVTIFISNNESPSSSIIYVGFNFENRLCFHPSKLEFCVIVGGFCRSVLLFINYCTQRKVFLFKY